MIEISKELLSEVLEYKVYDYTLKDTKIKINKITASTSCNEPRIIGYDKGINIHELAHKCKEWALKNGYYLRAEQGINYYDKLQWTCFLNKDMNDGADYVDYWNLTEVEAIIKACEWILSKIKEGN